MRGRTISADLTLRLALTMDQIALINDCKIKSTFEQPLHTRE